MWLCSVSEVSSAPGVAGADLAQRPLCLQVSVSESLDCMSLICHPSGHVACLLIIREFMVSHLVSALARCFDLLLVFLLLLLLLCLVFTPCGVYCLLQLCHACLWMIHPCMMQGIQGVLLVCCLCVNPPATTWRWGRQGPTRRKGSKGGVSGLAEDLRPVSEVEAGVNIRPASGVREQVAGSLPRGQPGTGIRKVRGGAVTPSLHPEVPGTLFASPGGGLGISNQRAAKPHDRGFGCLRVTPGLVCFLTILIIFGWDGGLGDHTRTPGLRQGTTVCVHTSMGVEQPSDHKLMTPSGVIGLWGRVAPLLSLWCARVNLNRYSGSSHASLGTAIPNQSKLRVSLAHSVEFQVRRASSDVPSSITLNRGDLLVMDGLAQSECAHRTMSGLQGPRVNLAYRWVTQRAASCPLAGVVGCVLPTCVQGLAEPGSRGSWGKINGSLFGELVFLLLFLVSVLLVSTWIHIGRGASSQLSASIPPGGAPPLVVPVGSGDGVGDCHDAANLPWERLFIVP